MYATWRRARDCEPKSQRNVGLTTICGKFCRDSCWSKDGRYYNGASPFIPHASHTRAPALHWHRLDRFGCGKAASLWHRTIHQYEEVTLWPNACCLGQRLETITTAPRKILPDHTNVCASSKDHQADLLSLGMRSWRSSQGLLCELPGRSSGDCRNVEGPIANHSEPGSSGG